jgi:hypothetical protein
MEYDADGWAAAVVRVTDATVKARAALKAAGR